MYESSSCFTSDQLLAMRAARPLGQLIADETLGYAPDGMGRILPWPSAITQGELTLMAPATTTPESFGDTWRMILREPEYAPFHELEVINTGEIAIAQRTTHKYANYLTYLVHNPEDELTDGLGIVVTTSFHNSHREHAGQSITDATTASSSHVETINFMTPYHIIDIPHARSLLTKIHLALEAKNA